MRRTFTKFNEIVGLLNAGWGIYTERGSGPARPLLFDIWDGNENSKRVHNKTIEKLIKDNIIYSPDEAIKTGHSKYSLKQHSF